VFSLSMQVEDDERDLLIANLWDAGATGLTEEDHGLRAFFGAENDARMLVKQFGDFRPTVQEEEETDWVRFAQSQWQPFAVGERFYLVPEWMDDPAPDGRLRLVMHPGMACGSGTHPATRLCLMAMERHVQPGASLIDVGTGAGILADAGRLLGAKPVFGCDIEHQATMVARNKLDGSISLFTGSARSVRSKAVQWAVCNLNVATLKNLSQDLLRISDSLILSGFTEDEMDKVAAMFKRAVREQMELDGYGCLVL
jgi:ribosomal protein L11 methyltransferase